MRSRFSAWLSSIRSASPRVPTSENARSRCSSAKSSQAAMNSRLSAARCSSSRPPPGRIDLQERVLDEVAYGIRATDDTQRGRIETGAAAGLRTAIARATITDGQDRPDRLGLRAMRIALVSPYSWTYPGGVTRHIEALAERFIEDGHDVRVLAPFDPADRLSTRAAPRRRAAARRARPTTSSRSGAPSASRPTARSRTSRSPRTASPRCSTRAAHRRLRRRPRPRADRAAC